MVSKARTAKAVAARPDFPLDTSVGYQIRMTHRLLQRYLQVKIEPYGITLGMWYFLRALWEEDGLTQSELSRRIGTMEPTTLSAILSMSRGGLVRRVRDKADRRKLHVYLTPKGRKLKTELLPLAREVVATATHDLGSADNRRILRLLQRIQRNLARKLSDLSEVGDDWASKPATAAVRSGPEIRARKRQDGLKR